MFISLISKLLPSKGALKPHLRGLTPIHQPVNHYWNQVSASDNLQAAFDWLCDQTKEASHNSDVWDYRRQWETRKSALQFALRTGQYNFQPVRMVAVEDEQGGETKWREVFGAEDRLVIRAITQVLQPVLVPQLSSNCTHLSGNGGIKQAVRDTQDYIAAHPNSFVIKSDVKSYYASIDLMILAEQLRTLLPQEVEFHHWVWQFMHRTTEFGGNYTDVEQRGLPMGASLSPLLGAVYLSPLDALAAEQPDSFYRRYMDDWVLILPKRHHLRRALKLQYNVLQALRVEVHPDKTFIGKVAKGFDFLGFHCSPTGMRVSDAALSRRDVKIARLNEQGASKKRIAQYLARWLGWAAVFAAGSGGAADSYNWSEAFHASLSRYQTQTGIYRIDQGIYNHHHIIKHVRGTRHCMFAYEVSLNHEFQKTYQWTSAVLDDRLCVSGRYWDSRVGEMVIYIHNDKIAWGEQVEVIAGEHLTVTVNGREPENRTAIGIERHKMQKSIATNLYALRFKVGTANSFVIKAGGKIGVHGLYGFRIAYKKSPTQTDKQDDEQTIASPDKTYIETIVSPDAGQSLYTCDEKTCQEGKGIKIQHSSLYPAYHKQCLNNTVSWLPGCRYGTVVDTSKHLIIKSQDFDHVFWIDLVLGGVGDVTFHIQCNYQTIVVVDRHINNMANTVRTLTYKKGNIQNCDKLFVMSIIPAYEDRHDTNDVVLYGVRVYSVD